MSERHEGLESILSDYAYTSSEDWQALRELQLKASELDRLKQAIKKAENKNPYRVIGQHDTYSEYNQGWQAALDFIDAEVNP